MATNEGSWFHNERAQTENVTNQLALAVRTMQWSYAIFWNISARQPGLLEWSDGYYNGDIKTRKTVQSTEFNADQLCLHRSEQLRELFESLSVGEDSPQAKRPTAALSPEDLTDAEWYYLVCMSFCFEIGQCLPGRTLANGKHTWVCNAQHADSKIFSRSLLAKSASIQTVVCFPFLSGVVELGMTELVLEDPSLVQQIKASFLMVSDNSIARNDNKFSSSTAADHRILDDTMIPVLRYEELASPSDSSDNRTLDDSIMVEGLNGGASPEKSWQFMDYEFTNCALHSINSSDCLSETVVDPVQTAPIPRDEQAEEPFLQGFEAGSHSKLTALDLKTDALHYQSVLSCLLKTSHSLVLGPYLGDCHQESSFINWKKEEFMHPEHLKCRTQQKVLKKMLFEVPRMHSGCLNESPEDEVIEVGVWRPEADDIGSSHVLSERKRREKLNKRFTILKSILPSITKTDKVSILDDTIEYLQELERRVEELESNRDSMESDARTRRKPQDTVDRVSDNYNTDRTGKSGKKPSTNKRKACDSTETETEDSVAVVTDGDQVLIKINNPWRDGILIEIMDAISKFHLDSHSVQSITNEGILHLTVKSKVKGLSAASAATIRQALKRVVQKD